MSPRKDSVRDRQLAKIVAEELSMILDSAHDERLGLIEILRVEAKPGGSSFLVLYGPPTIAPEEVPEIADRRDAQEILDRAKGFLRSELVPAINVKNAIDVTFAPSPLEWEAWEARTRDPEEEV